jgi:1-aminocyclopropane-1-carboxylate deaminase/D-cysteine desulfhydrase-like pyridoxal-dependent ACC family enzyme
VSLAPGYHRLVAPALEDLPRFRLFDGPSPFHRLERLGAALGGRTDLWIKREDLLPLAFGGNKLRNLEFLVGAAIAEDADTLVTSGRRWSNHCRLTAAAGARAGLAVHLVLSGPVRGPEGAQAAPNPGRILAELLGATVHQLPTADRAEREATVDRIAAELRAAGRRPHVIEVGGSGMPGVAGQVLAARELLSQVASGDARPPDVIVLPSATGGTQAGLLAGLRQAGSTTEIVGILVARPEGELRPAIGRTLAQLAPVTGVTVPVTEIVLDAGQLGGGYGVRSAAADDATRLLARTEGILVDPIYTAKALAGLIDGVRSGRWDGGRVVFWHAGGTPGLFEPLDDVAAP